MMNNIKSLCKSFKFALRGIMFCLKNERNMRIHSVTALIVITFSLIYGLTSLQFAVLLIAIAFVIASEMVNTSIEALVDLQTSAYADLARIAKDVAAGAVFLSAGCAICVGIAFFFKFPKLCDTLVIITTTPLYIASFAVIIIFGVLFIFKGFEMFKLKKR